MNLIKSSINSLTTFDDFGAGFGESNPQPDFNFGGGGIFQNAISPQPLTGVNNLFAGPIVNIPNYPSYPDQPIGDNPCSTNPKNCGNPTQDIVNPIVTLQPTTTNTNTKAFTAKDIEYIKNPTIVPAVVNQPPIKKPFPWLTVILVSVGLYGGYSMLSKPSYVKAEI